jgi:hypothetical protein
MHHGIVRNMHHGSHKSLQTWAKSWRCTGETYSLAPPWLCKVLGRPTIYAAIAPDGVPTLFFEMGHPSLCITMIDTTSFIITEKQSYTRASQNIITNHGSQRVSTNMSHQKRDNTWSAFASICQAPVITPSPPAEEILCNHFNRLHPISIVGHLSFDCR